MTVNDFSALYDYASWANGQLLAVVKQLTPQQFTRDVAGSYGSVRNTMVHMLSAEWGWLDRCGGPSRGAKLNPDDYPTVESLSETWARVEGYMREFLSRLTDEDLARVIEFALPGGLGVDAGAKAKQGGRSGVGETCGGGVAEKGPAGYG